MSQPIQFKAKISSSRNSISRSLVGMKMLVSLIFSIALACVATAGKHNQGGNGPSAGQFSQPRGNAMGNPTPTATPRPTPKTVTTGKPTNTDKPTNTGKSANTAKSDIGKSAITGKSTITGEPTTTGKHKETRVGKGKPVTTPVPSGNVTNTTTGKSGAPVQSPTPSVVVSTPTPTQKLVLPADQLVVPNTNQQTQQVVIPNTNQPTTQPSATPITVQQVAIPVINQPTQGFSVAPVTNQSTPQPSAVSVSITNQPTQGFDVVPNPNQSTQPNSAVSVTSGSSVTGQQTQTNTNQSQIATGVAPSATPFRAVAQPSVSGQVGSLQTVDPRTGTSTSGFNPVTITNPNAKPVATSPPGVNSIANDGFQILGASPSPSP